jgi:uncharacterized protein
MKRTAEQYLTEWLMRTGRKPLILRGARQVGKTTLVENWAKSRFESILKIDLERDYDMRDLFRPQSSFDPAEFLQQLFYLKKIRFIPGKTLLFLDEIQAEPKAIACLRYFHELMPDLPVIAAGSLLEFALREFSYSMPVGRVEYLHLKPMTFLEFVEAVDGQELASFLDSVTFETVISAPLGKKLTGLLRAYFFVGGMPEAVLTYADKGGLMDVRRVQSSLIQTYQDDFSKYASRAMRIHILNAFDYVSRNVGKKVKYVNINRDAVSNDIKQGLFLLAQSRVIHLVHHTAATGVPLGAGKNLKHFKGLFLDVGLANRQCGIEMSWDHDLLMVHEGALAEQFVGQELLCQTPFFEDPELFYWHREAKNANAEIDYLVPRGSDIVPIEVKSGKAGAMKSLFLFLREKRRTQAVRLYSGPLTRETLTVDGNNVDLLSAPLFLVGRLHALMREAWQR